MSLGSWFRYGLPLGRGMPRPYRPWRRPWWVVLLTFALPLTAVGRQDDGVRTARIQALAKEVLHTQYPDDAYRLSVRVKRIAATLDPSAGLRLVFPAAAHLPRGTTQVKLLAGEEAAGWERVGWALLDVVHSDSVVLAQAAFRSGEEITSAAVGVAWVETTAFRGEPLRPAALRVLTDAGAVYATRLIRAGQMLRASDVRPAFAAETGSAVTMQYRRAGISFDLVCKAREAGYLDDEIRLYSADTGKTYRARLTEPGLATWIETL